MKVKELMTSSVIIISADSTIKVASDVMKQNDIGAIPVQDGGVLKGMITDRDIVIRAIASGREPNSVTVGDIMTPRLLTCFEDQDAVEAVELMKKNKVRRIVVLNRDENPVGIVSLGDIAAHADMKLIVETVKKVSEPVHSM